MAKHGDLILSLDLGTTAIKVGLFSASGDLLQLATKEQQLSFPASDRVEQSLMMTWELVCDGVREVLTDSNPSEVLAVVITNQRGSVVPLDEQGEPLSNLMVWMDTRGLKQVERLHELVGAKQYYNTSGHPIVPITGISKVLWLQQEAPDLWNRTSSLGPPQTLFLRWLGCEDSMVDVSSGSYLFPNDIRKKTWSEEIAKKLSFPLEKLPRLVKATEIVGELSRPAARDLGLPAGIPIVAGGGDGQCAAAGTGIVVPGIVMVNIGTATGVQVFLDKPRFDQGHTLNCAAHVVPEAWEMEGHTQASGTVLRWFRDEFGDAERLIGDDSQRDVYNLIIDQAQTAPPGAEGLIFLPTFNGSTAPIVDPFARGALIGLKLAHQRGHVIRSILEGISLEIRWILDTMAGADVPIKEVRLAGGGSRNPFWNQIHADIFGRQVKTIQNPDAALVGGAMCAAVGLKIYPDFTAAAEAFVKPGPLVEPITTNTEMYEETYAHFVRLFKLLSEENAFIR